jgi:hypothetical protein
MQCGVRGLAGNQIPFCSVVSAAEGNSAVGLISHHPSIDAKKVLLAPPLYEQSLSFILGPHNQVFFFFLAKHR